MQAVVVLHQHMLGKCRREIYFSVTVTAWYIFGFGGPSRSAAMPDLLLLSCGLVSCCFSLVPCDFANCRALEFSIFPFEQVQVHTDY